MNSYLLLLVLMCLAPVSLYLGLIIGLLFCLPFVIDWENVLESMSKWLKYEGDEDTYHSSSDDDEGHHLRD